MTGAEVIPIFHAQMSMIFIPFINVKMSTIVGN